MFSCGVIATSILAFNVLAEGHSLIEELQKREMIAPPVSSQSESPARIYWNKGTRIEFPEQHLTHMVQTFIQTRYVYSRSNKEKAVSDFEVNKARLTFSGTALSEEFSYYLHVDFLGGTAADKSRSASLKDAYISWLPVSFITTKIGQFKMPISRQYLTGDFATQFIERSIASDYFSTGREGGARAEIRPTARTQLGVGISNGKSTHEGANLSGVDVYNSYFIDGHYTPFGTMNYAEEGDIDWSDSWALGLGGAFMFGESREELPTSPIRNSIEISNLDVSLKGHGVGIHGELYRTDTSVQGDPLVTDATPQGGYIQAGYFVQPKLLELSARYSAISCDGGAARGSCAGTKFQSQSSLGASYFLIRHSLKLQLNWDFLRKDASEEDAADKDSKRITFQVSSYL